MSRLSIGLPVRNGESYIREALTAALSQEYGDVDILISDNASTDATEDACKEALGDSRVRYERLTENVGARENFNRTFHLTSGEFFCWAAHDDRMLPKFLERCIEELDKNPDAAMCATSVVFINDKGDPVGEFREGRELTSSHLGTRLRGYLRRPAWFMAYGVARRSALERTGLLPLSFGPDVILVWEVLLRNRLCVVEEPLFEYRSFRGSGKRAEATTATMAPDLDPDWHRFGSCKMWREMWRKTGTVPLSRGERTTARRELVLWFGTRYWRRLLFNDFYSDLRLARAGGRRGRSALCLGIMLLLRPLYCLGSVCRGVHTPSFFGRRLRRESGALGDSEKTWGQPNLDAGQSLELAINKAPEAGGSSSPSSRRYGDRSEAAALQEDPHGAI